MILVDVAGWVGVVVFLLAYFLVSVRRLEADSVAYQLLNVAGGVLLIVNSSFHQAYPSVAVNVAWVGIGLYVLARRRRNASKG